MLYYNLLTHSENHSQQKNNDDKNHTIIIYKINYNEIPRSFLKF